MNHSTIRYINARILHLLAMSSLLLGSLLVAPPVKAREMFVAKSGSDLNPGDAAHPFLTIQRAAEVAEPGDTVTVRAGIYRERVDPQRGGTSEDKRIVYRAAANEDVRIVGSERVAQWVREGSYWSAVLPASFFGAFNPFATLIKNPASVGGDNKDGWGWLRYGRWTHLGDVYLNGQGLTEQETDAGLEMPLTWRASVDDKGTTTIKANFGDEDPNAGWVEVNVRPTLFYPSKPGLNYITLQGFTLMNAACHWTPPIVEQQAAVGPNGGSHWIIENNTILYAKAVAISLGIPSGPADKASAGHHIIRDNVIMRCGQAGIIGEFWNRHCSIIRNSIEDINYRHEFGGAETGGIKFHRSVETVIEGNFIRNVGTENRKTSNGDAIWLDVGNIGVKIRNNVIVDAEGNSILIEANWSGANYVENNVVVGGLMATYSSRDTVWSHNLVVDAPGDWVNQEDLKRPPITGAIWEGNIFIQRGVAEGPDATRDNLYLGGAKPRVGESGAIATDADPRFGIDIDDSVVTIRFQIDAETYQIGRANEGVGLDFFGSDRSKQLFGSRGFAYGPFANVKAGENVIAVFRFNPRRAHALQILKTGLQLSTAASR